MEALRFAAKHSLLQDLQLLPQDLALSLEGIDWLEGLFEASCLLHASER